jgi:hypothetical protein
METAYHGNSESIAELAGLMALAVDSEFYLRRTPAMSTL